MLFSQYFSFLGQYHSTNAPDTFIYQRWYTVFSSSISVSTASIILPKLYTHAFICTSLLPEGQKGEAGEPAKNKAIF
jgi:hypothetical protein